MELINLVSISLCMIVKNEENTLGRCLETIKDLVEEIIIVDTGSTDKTKEVAMQFTDKIFDFDWIDDFAAARNYSFQFASQEYTMWLDADDILYEKDRQLFKELKETLNPFFNTVTMDYIVGRGTGGETYQMVRRNRLVKTNKYFQWKSPVHEYLEISGPVYHSDIAITHLSKPGRASRNLLIYEKRLKEGKDFSVRDLLYYANELRRHKSYEEAINIYERFLAEPEGLNEDKIIACGRLADCYFRLGEHEKELETAFKSFKYAKPRADFCCRIGYKFLSEEKIQEATFWYNLATELEWDKDCLGIYNVACWTWLPHLQLCSCYYKLGDYQKSYEHNQIALSYRPNDERMIGNKRLLEGKLAEWPTKK
ncbi:glycosyltransferase family 2 protein [Bacillus sp. FJAT-49711]|uniref:tetratricopeptide repeat-containing glycosyltransferase family 2 protein n=1 Tax=Bacillus sp. FJAT-49711 TaxID=2833585 RepID=UPI0032D5ADA3